ncbi:hypothetical protein QBC37DRAFT_202104 [Rhypophila decipiens]|uniref:Uncharacterized protein n=1 Tax=Rhypophila decipiens TaxID=261697 RepID=A0AAN7B8M0_9PEZI|nr:hypothetical protein QBC37DRAFT_202104 [Rhypophila decipiens]
METSTGWGATTTRVDSSHRGDPAALSLSVDIHWPPRYLSYQNQKIEERKEKNPRALPVKSPIKLGIFRPGLDSFRWTFSLAGLSFPAFKFRELVLEAEDREDGIFQTRSCRSGLRHRWPCGLVPATRGGIAVWPELPTIINLSTTNDIPISPLSLRPASLSDRFLRPLLLNLRLSCRLVGLAGGCQSRSLQQGKKDSIKISQPILEMDTPSRGRLMVSGKGHGESRTSCLEKASVGFCKSLIPKQSISSMINRCHIIDLS